MTYKILYYINQFFAGIGGEDKADYHPEVRKGPIGPAIQYEKNTNEEAQVVATFICGDNYFAEHVEEVLEKFSAAIKEYDPDLIIAGPSFYAGRYGFACGHVIKHANDNYSLTGVAGMNIESPAVEMFRKDMFIVKTGNSARSMKEALEDITKLSLKILKGVPLGSADEEKYYHRVIRKNYFVNENGGIRAVNMLLRKMNKEDFQSEYIQLIPEKVPFAPYVKDMQNATVVLLNTGGIVPEGNPDRIESSSATKYGRYDITGMDKLDEKEFMSIHGGFDTSFANADPNRIVPVDVMKELEKEGIIKKLYNYIYSTVGTGASLVNAEGFGRDIAKQLIDAEVTAAIMVST